MHAICVLLIAVVACTLLDGVTSRKTSSVNEIRRGLRHQRNYNQRLQGNVDDVTNDVNDRISPALDVGNVDRSDGLDLEFDVRAPQDDVTRMHRHRSGGRKRKNKKQREEERVRESAWYYCANGTAPRKVASSTSRRGVMCYREYPAHSCCLNHDLTFELVGSKITEQVPNIRCARFLMKLRCAHCSPRSWWLFHAPDKQRHPHKRDMPILCPAFCRKLHLACRDSIAGLQNDNFCDFHTTNEGGPCFPDYEIRRGTID